MTDTLLLDLGVSDVHTPSASGKRERTMSEISTEKRNALPAGKFALPDKRKYPIHDANHVRNAAARLQQAKKKGKISDADYSKARAAIARAAKKFGIESEFNASDDAAPAPRRAPRQLHIRADLAQGGSLHVRHLSDGEDRTFYSEVHLMADAATADVKPVWIQLAKSGSFAGHAAGPFELNTRVFEEIVRNFKATENKALPVDYEHASEAPATDGSIPVAGAPAQGWIRDLKIDGGNLFGLVEWLPQAREQIRAGQYKFISPAIRFGAKDRVTGASIGARLTSAGLTNSPFLDGMRPLAARDTAASVTMRGKMLAHKPHEYMGDIRSALSMHPLATAAECADHLEKLRDHVAECGDAEGMHEGVDLGAYTRPLRNLVGAVPGTTWEEVFDVVEDLIDAAIDKHVIEDHGGQAAMKDDQEETTMSDEKTVIALRDAQTEVSTLTLKLKESESKNTALEGELKTLRDWKSEREEKDLQNEVQAAFDTYKDKKGLKDEDKKHMLVMCKSAPDAFRAMYPSIPADQRVLLRTITPPEPRPVVEDAPIAAMSFSDLTVKLMTDKKISYSAAADEAIRILNGG